jgi:transcriptional regulator with XRE-family HTH domain
VLRAARLRRGLTQKALSRKLGVTSHEISQIERGVVDLRFSELQEVSRLLDLELVLIPRQQIAAVAALQVGTAAALKRPLYALGPDDIDDEGARVEEKFGYLRNAAPRRR